MPVSTQRLTASQFCPEDRQRLNINRGDRIDMRTTPAGDGVELFVNGRQRHEVRAIEMSVQDMYFRVAYEQARADDAARIEAAAAQLRALSDRAIMDELGATEDRVAAVDVHLSNLAATPNRPVISARALAETWLQEAAPVPAPEVRIDPNMGARFTIPRGLQGATRANFERWHMPYASGGSSSVVVEIESEIADLRRHGYEPKVIAVDGNVMSHLRASTAFQWQHRVQPVPTEPADIDDIFGESATQVEGTLFGIRLIQDDQTEGYVIAVKR